MADEDKPHIRWDEPNLKSNEEYAATNPKMKIDEPKTPYHHGKGPESLASPVMQPQPGAALPVEAAAAGEYHEFHLEAGMHDPAALSASALERRNRDSDDEEADGGKGAPHQSRGLPSHVAVGASTTG